MDLSGAEAAAVAAAAREGRREEEAASTVVVVTEARFVRTPDGSLWSQHSAGDDFWQRYLTEFGRVEVIARTAARLEPPVNAAPLTDPRVRVVELPPLPGGPAVVLPLQLAGLLRAV
jgi:hypothetical protein